jgi:DnaJ homolog subfamily A member 2
MTSHIKAQVVEAFNTENLYEVFNLSADASESDIKKSFRKLALIHHPDKGGNESKFKALCVVYGILSDSEKRKEYDQSGLDGRLYHDQCLCSPFP